MDPKLFPFAQTRHVIPNTQHLSSRSPQRHPKASPRKVKLQQVGPIKAMVQGHESPSFRHEVFTFYQTLTDAITKTLKEFPNDRLARDHHVFEILTSDQGDSVLRQFFQLLKANNNITEDEVLWHLLEMLFKNSPLIVSESDVKDAKRFVRYTDMLGTLREVINQMLYKSLSVHKEKPSQELHLLTFPRSKILQKEKIPYYQYCEQLEIELQVQKNIKEHAKVKKAQEDIGLMREDTVSLLLNFWELPKLERLHFLCQIAAHTEEDETESVLRVFLENCDAEHVVQILTAVKYAVPWGQLLAGRIARRRGEKPTINTSKSTEKHSSDKDSGNEEETGNQLLPPYRQGKNSTKEFGARDEINLNGLTEAFEKTEEEENAQDDLKKTLGGTGPRSRHRNDQNEKKDLRQKKSRREDHVIETVYGLLLEFFSDDHEEMDFNVIDAAAKLLDQIDAMKAKRSDKTGKERKQLPGSYAKWKNRHGKRHVETQTVKEDALKRIHQLEGSLMFERQFLHSVEDFESSLRILSTASLSTLSAEAVAQAYHTVSGLSGAFETLVLHTNEAVGLEKIPVAIRDVTKKVEVVQTKVDEEVFDSVHSLMRRICKMMRAVAKPIAKQKNPKRNQAILQMVESFEEEVREARAVTNNLELEKISSPLSVSATMEAPKDFSTIIKHVASSDQYERLVKLLKSLDVFAGLVVEALKESSHSAHEPQTFRDETISLETLLRVKGGRTYDEGQQIHAKPKIDNRHNPDAEDEENFDTERKMQCNHDKSKQKDRVRKKRQKNPASSSKESRGTAVTENGHHSSQTQNNCGINEHEIATGYINHNRVHDSIDPHQEHGTKHVNSSESVNNRKQNEARTTESRSRQVNNSAEVSIALDEVKEVDLRQFYENTDLLAFETTSAIGMIGDHGPDGFSEFESEEVLSRAKASGDPTKKETKALKHAKNSSSKTKRDSDSDSDSSGGDSESDSESDSDSDSESEEDNIHSTINADSTSRARNHLKPLSIRLKKKKAPKLFSVGILLRMISQLYRENFECTGSLLQYGAHRIGFSEFMYDWHIRKYGLKNLAHQHLLKFIQSLKAHEEKSYSCHLCLRFLGIINPLGYHEHKFILRLVDKWSNGTFSGCTQHRIQFLARQFKLRTSITISSIQEALLDRFGVYFHHAEELQGRLKAAVMPNDEKFIKEDDAIKIAIEEWLSSRQRIFEILQAVYNAGDLNGDQSLEYDEFAAVMFHLAPALEENFIKRVFNEAHDQIHPKRVSFERFLDVIFLEKILSPSISDARMNNSKNSHRNKMEAARKRSSLSIELQDEEYQFRLLMEEWQHDQEVVEYALSQITHQATVASIQFRVKFLNQIIAKRVDAKTAWQCHRQIMCDVSRYQNLKEEEIVVLQTKKKMFKKAIKSILSAQRLTNGLHTSDTTIPPQHLSGGSTFDFELTSTLDEFDPLVSYINNTVELTDSSNLRQVTNIEMEALEQKLREQFLERADENVIEDYKMALNKLRRMSVALTLSFNFPGATEEGDSYFLEGVEKEDEDNDDDIVKDTEEISEQTASGDSSSGEEQVEHTRVLAVEEQHL